MSNYLELLKDPRWQRKRLEIFERDKFICQSCGSDKKTLHVHHFYYNNCDPWEYPNDALITLCNECHEKEEFLKGFALSSIHYLSSLGFLYSDISTIIQHISQRIDTMDEDERKNYIQSIKNLILK